MARRIIDKGRHKNIMLERVDRDLFDRALAKAQLEPPPHNKLKWQIIRLVQEWVDRPARRQPSPRCRACGGLLHDGVCGNLECDSGITKAQA